MMVWLKITYCKVEEQVFAIVVTAVNCGCLLRGALL